MHRARMIAEIIESVFEPVPVAFYDDFLEDGLDVIPMNSKGLLAPDNRAACNHLRQELLKLDDEALYARHLRELDPSKLNFRLDEPANYDFWARNHSWKFHEAAALLVGKEPSHKMHVAAQALCQSSVFAKRYTEIASLLERKFYSEAGAMVEPVQIISWAKQTKIMAPAKLKDLIGEIYPTTKERPEKPLMTLEKETLLKIIIGMAVAGYTYKPGASKNEAVTEIMDDLVRLGVPVSDDTIRKWLKEASALLPKQ